jgi:hypothetical protein
VERKNPCRPSPCGHGALCDPDLSQPCYCPDHLVGNPYRACTGINVSDVYYLYKLFDYLIILDIISVF